MSKTLEYWRIRDVFTLSEAALLIIEQYPHNWTSEALLSDPPDNFRAIYDQMLEDAQIILEANVPSLEDPDDYQDEYVFHTRSSFELKCGRLTSNEKLLIKVTKENIKKWLKFVKKSARYFDDENLTTFELSTTEILTLNINDHRYPPELGIAILAWRAISSLGANKGRTPKQTIREWLDKKYPTDKELSNEAKERISIVANWNKSGGSARTD